MTLTDLLHELEKAEGPSRGLDIALWREFREKPVIEAAGAKTTSTKGRNYWGAPHYTSSIDAAVALLLQAFPETGNGRDFRLFLERQPNSGLWTAVLRRHGSGVEHESCKRTGGLSLCTAIVRAKLEETNG